MARFVFVALSSIVIACGAGGGPGVQAPAPSARDQALAACMQDCNMVAATCPVQMGDACNQAMQACVGSCEQMAAMMPDVPVDQGQPPVEQQVEQPAEQPAAELNELARVVQVLTANGYSCTQEELRYLCNVPTDGWQVAVAWLVETDKISIWYDSYQMRAFARPCAEFENAMKDLASPDNAYVVSCDDKFQSFRMNTAVLYTPDMDVMGWMQSHLQRRAESVRLLSSISALRQ